MAASAASGVAAEIQRLLSVARKSTDGAERATTLRSATFELLEHGTGLLREVVPQIMEFMDDRAPLVRACVVRFIVELALRSPLWLPQLAASLERASSDDHEIVQASVGRAVSKLYPLALAMRVANPQTGEVMPTTPPKVEAAWAVMEQLRDAVAALSISPEAPDAVRLPAIAALRGAALAHSLPSVLAVRVAERAARAAAAAGVLSVSRSAHASAPAITGLCLRPTAGTSVATEEAAKALARSRKRASDALSLTKALEEEDADTWPAPLIGVPPDDVFSGASIPGSHGTVDAAACLSTGDDAVAVLALLLCRNPSADAAEAGTPAPRCPFTARTYSALLSALADVAAARPNGLVDAAVQGIVGFGATPPRDLVPSAGATLADLPAPVAAALRAAIIKVLRKAGSAVRQSHKVALQATLATLGAAAEGEAAAAAGLRLPLWSIIATDTPVWDMGAAAPSAALMGWGAAGSQPPPPSADERAAIAALASAARGEDAKDASAQAGAKAQGSALDRVSGAVLSDAELLNQMRAITPAARRKVALAALAALPYPVLEGAEHGAEGGGSDKDRPQLTGAAFLSARSGGAGVVEWAAETGGFACAGAVRLAVAPLVKEFEAKAPPSGAAAAAKASTRVAGSLDGAGARVAGSAAAGAQTDALADLAAAFGAAHDDDDDDDPAASAGAEASKAGAAGHGTPSGPGGAAGAGGRLARGAGEVAEDDSDADDDEEEAEEEGDMVGAGAATRERAAAAAAASAAAAIVAAQEQELGPLSAKRAWVQANEAFRRVVKTPPELLAASGRHALLCDAVEQGSLEAAEGLEVLGDVAKARPGARPEAVAAVLRLCVAWSSETRRHAVGLMVLSLLALAPDQVEAFATRAFWSLAVSDEVVEEDGEGDEDAGQGAEEGEEEEEEEEDPSDGKAEAAAGSEGDDHGHGGEAAGEEAEGGSDESGDGEGAEDPSALLPSEAVLQQLESCAPVSKGDAVRRAQLLVGVATRRLGLLADVVAPVYAVAPRQRAAIDQELEPLLLMLLGAPDGTGARGQ
ncbi:hypothetical protein FNF28_07063 [Cafeteria roenbergensis]|uniref:Symplekin/Pta1 N-terminal domain-containing protein n=1 Tax=Cafeteria roenbergensis TaxID=33653 RepID=A0A5A8CI24_CAFRO|nr:hypothetical protein FNF28_07063 [Cafeteria roenbergensis]